jgi:arsenite methyltransferase
MKNNLNTIIPQIDKKNLRTAISKEYTEVACNLDHTIHFTSGFPLAIRLGYPEGILKTIPEEAVRPFAGVGNPFKMGTINLAETILDIGSGAGMDCIFASFYGNRSNIIWGLDMTEAMLEKARNNARIAGSEIRFIKGYAENIPLPDSSIDLVISNGVINLCPDKELVYKEIYRVLRPGGRFMIGDVLLERPVPSESRELIHLWTNCVAGAIIKDEYIEVINKAGFLDIQIMEVFDVFSDARIAKSASYFGAKGYNIKGIKAL